MDTKGTRIIGTSTILITLLLASAVLPMSAQAGSWFFSLNVPYCGGYYSYPEYIPPYYPTGYDYYPVYNPVVDREVYGRGYRSWNGTRHSDTTVEDRHATYYSPGRNQAITPPRTSVQRSWGPGYNQSRERTSWIGSDGLPHSTTINRVTRRDFWGNTHTDTHVSLKNRRANNPKPSVQPKAPSPPKTPIKVPGRKIPVPGVKK